MARTWGGAQQLTGPFVVVPYMVRVETKDGDKIVSQTQERRAVFLPEDLAISGKAASKVLHRSIFDVNVYTATLAVSGRFAVPDMTEVDPNAISVRWRDAVLVLALSDVAGLKEAATVTINGRETLPFAPSLGVPGCSYPRRVHERHARQAVGSAVRRRRGGGTQGVLISCRP